MDNRPRETRSAKSSTAISKRKAAACLQCRDRKVRCSGTCPCVNCTRRSQSCVFEQDEKKVLVSERLLNDLKRRAGHGEPESAPRPQKRQMTEAGTEGVFSSSVEQNDSRRQPSDGIPEGDNDYAMKNPLVESPSKFLTDIRGRRRFLGPSSTWAYSRQVLGLLQDHLQHHESPEMPRNVDGMAFPLALPQVNLPENCIDLGTLPPLDYAIYLTNTVKFHIGQTYHLMDEVVFNANLSSLYNDELAGQMTSITRLWLSQYFIIMALGKALLHRGFSKSCPFGKDYFLRGMEFMPDISSLYDDPVLAIEVCCAIALYLQSVDHRNTAFVYLGIALRIALSQGIHQDSIDDPQSKESNDRRRSAWWTMYILDRKFSYMMGSPSQINDDAITIGLPGSPYFAPQKVIAMDVHVKLCRIIGKVIDNVYAVDGRLRASFLRIVQSTLQELAALAEILTASIDLNFDGSSSINRTSGTLNLCYHQCIILATRPLLVCLLREKLRNREAAGEAQRDLAGPIKALLRTSSDSANKSLRILSALHARDLLDVFLPFDLEYAFSASFILSLTAAIYPFPDTVDPRWMETAISTIDGLVENGQVSARFRREEVERLHDMLRQVTDPEVESAISRGAEEPDSDMHNSAGPIEGISSTAILSVADLIGHYPIMDMDSGFLEGDWLWQDDFARWQGTSLPDGFEAAPQSG